MGTSTTQQGGNENNSIPTPAYPTKNRDNFKTKGTSHRLRSALEHSEARLQLGGGKQKLEIKA